MSILEKEFPELFSFINEGKVKVGYNKKFREFFIPLNSKGAVQLIYYCPWTGKKLPKSVRDEYFEIVDQLNAIPAATDATREMQSEEWWIKLNL